MGHAQHIELGGGGFGIPEAPDPHQPYRAGTHTRTTRVAYATAAHPQAATSRGRGRGFGIWRTTGNAKSQLREKIPEAFMFNIELDLILNYCVHLNPNASVYLTR